MEQQEELDDFILSRLAPFLPKKQPIFMGKASRSCKYCGMQKLYKDFNNSRVELDPCNACVWQEEQRAMLEALNDIEKYEIYELEDEISDNEYEIERQELIYEFLRGLDE